MVSVVLPAVVVVSVTGAKLSLERKMTPLATLAASQVPWMILPPPSRVLVPVIVYEKAMLTPP